MNPASETSRPQEESILEVLSAPAEFMALRQRDLNQTVCVVFDILRATSTMMTALGNGAERVIPVSDIAEALAIRKQTPGVLLAGERNGVRIRADQTGGTDFDLGNSPREFSAEAVRGKTIVMTTTNGTRALRACASAQSILIGTFLGLAAVAEWVKARRPNSLLLIGAGTIDQASYEDTLAAGALLDLVWPLYQSGRVADSAFMARQLFRDASGDLFGAMQFARNGRRLLGNSELREDVPFCLQRDPLNFIAGMTSDGVVKAIAG